VRQFVPAMTLTVEIRSLLKKNLTIMKTLIAVTVPFVVLSSFAFMGAHSFSIQLDDKQISEQYVSKEMSVPRIVIEPAENRQNLVVKYSECGRTVSGRKITAKDNNDKVLKEWKFDGTTSGFKDAMSVSVKDLVALKKGSNNVLKLFYSSNDFPESQQIANVVVSPSVANATK
jgi:hypothetical protein